MSAALLLVCLLSSTLQEPVAPTQAASSVIRGRVVDGATGKLIRQARVVLSVANPTPTTPRADRITRTDDDGRFEVKDVPQGQYTLSVSKSRYVTAIHGQTRPDTPGKPIDVGLDGPTIVVTLRRAAVITGRVLDDLGEPVANAPVQAMKAGYRKGFRTLVPVGRLALTNDLGDYRLTGLASGEYFVAAWERLESFGSSAEADIGLARMLSPGTRDTRQARVVATVGGEDVAGVDITLAVAQTSALSGIVTGASGAPAGGARLVLQAIDEEFGGVGSEATSLPEGSYVFSKVLPGRYELHARWSSGPGQFQGAVIPITIAGADMVVPVALIEAGNLRGRIVLPENAALEPADVRLMAAPVADTNVFGTGFGGPIRADWTFYWATLIAPRVIRVSFLPPGWRVSAVIRGNADISDTPTLFKNPDAVEVVLSRDAAQLTGTAVGDDGKAAPDFTAVVFSEESGRWTYWSRFIHTARADQRGEFKLDGLSPGRYLIAAVASVEPDQWLNTEYLEHLRAVATPVTLEAGDRRALSLKVVTP